MCCYSPVIIKQQTCNAFVLNRVAARCSELSVRFDNWGAGFGNFQKLVPFFVFRFWFHQQNSVHYLNGEQYWLHIDYITKHDKCSLIFHFSLHVKKTKNLYKTLLDILATSFEPKHSFSAAGFFMIKICIRLSDNSVNALNFLCSY